MADRILRIRYGDNVSAENRFKSVVTYLQQLIEDGLRDEYVRRKAVSIVDRAGVKGHDELGEIQALIQYFQGSFTTNTPNDELGMPLLFGDRGAYRYQKDPYGHELFQSPPKVLRDIQSGESGADCDDIAAAAACCLAAAGYPAMLMIVDADPDLPGVFNHVMLATKTL